MSIVLLVLIALWAYALGSIPSGVIVSRAFAKVDVRTVGSGHTGALNTFRAAGFTAAALAFLADGAKGVLAVLTARQLAPSEWLIPVSATMVVAGHCWSLFTRGRGGMGLTTAGAVFLVLQPLVLIPLFALWFLCKWLLQRTQYASLIVAVALPILLFILQADATILASGIGVGAVLAARHAQVFLTAQSG